ncbi:MAG: hypothetical protein A2Z21_06280 [Candidatus Fraserbacteria bacterium RBG_16_55_9]|uniref:Polymerase nucleotidyl transferase domain-containing protein n=1 Tax=Fraserbacteria sp. (strain RBG_16_55_9) TaxID=1817864 RepID=A0A1F5UST5_FRAXR|nr:MAG: hypothetical protein A2Z21_06280 [Candidatus Fraserbacteria bacterium RBG_16_55_9]
MARLDERAEQFIRDFTRQMTDLYGDDLRSVILYGSAAGLHFLPGISDLNLLIVLRGITPARLRQAHDRLRHFRKERLQPLFLAPSQLATLADFYPIELLEMKEQHRVLHGEDFLQGVGIPRDQLRLQLISELTGKSLKLRALYLEAGRDTQRLEEILRSVTASFQVLMRTLLRLIDENLPPPSEYLEILTQLEERSGLELPGFRDVYQVKLGARRLLREEMDGLFGQLLNEVEILTLRASEIASTS